MSDAIPLCCKFSQGISFGEVGCSCILSIFGTYLTACLVSHFLRTTTNFLGTLLQISKGEVFSFFHLCSYICIPFKINVDEGRLILDFDNAFAFTLYSKIFSPFAKCTPFVTFLNGAYNLKFKRFPFEIHNFVTPLRSMLIDLHFRVFLT